MITAQDIQIGETYKLRHFGDDPVERTVLKIDQKKERITYQKGGTDQTGDITIDSFVRLYNQWGVRGEGN